MGSTLSAGYMDNVRLWSSALEDDIVAVTYNRHVHPLFDQLLLGKLIANYSFAETGVDGHTGTYNLVPSLSVQYTHPYDQAENKVLLEPVDTRPMPSAILFGPTTKVEIPYSDALLPTNTGLTFEAWIKPSTTGAQGGFIAAMGYRGWGITLMCTGSGAGCCQGGTFVDHAIGFWSSNDASYTCEQQPTSTAPVTPGEWNHIAVTFAPSGSSLNPRGDGGKVCFWIDGVASGCSADAVTTHTLTSGNEVGFHTCFDPWLLKGVLGVHNFLF